MDMKKRFFLLSVLFLSGMLMLSACATAAAPRELKGESTPYAGSASGEKLEGTVAISGAFALYPMMTRWAEEFQKLHPDVKFDISAGGAGKGMTDALTGAVDIGMVSRDVKPEEEAQSAYAVAVTKDGVFPVVNAQNPVLAEILAQGITQETLVKIYITGEITTWGQVVGKPEISAEIHVFTRSDAAGAPEMWSKYLGDKKQEDLLGIGVNGDPGVLEAVIKDPLGIGYNNLGYAYDLASGKPVAGVMVAPIDINQNGTAEADEILETMPEAIDAVASGRYPSPPARLLNLVTKGKPDGLTQAFIQWILTDGQALVSEAGYVQLTPAQLTDSLEKVK
jgi:phosphate transport system substrate-binding protein